MLAAQLCWTLCDPMDYIAWQAPLSMEFSRQEYWSGALPNSGIESRSPELQGDFLPCESPGKALMYRQPRVKVLWHGPHDEPTSHLPWRVSNYKCNNDLGDPFGHYTNLNFSPLHPKVKTSNTCKRNSPSPELTRFSQCSLLKGRKQLSETLT